MRSRSVGEHAIHNLLGGFFTALAAPEPPNQPCVVILRKGHGEFKQKKITVGNTVSENKYRAKKMQAPALPERVPWATLEWLQPKTEIIYTEILAGSK
jgi:hypothetical protein